MSNCLAYVAYGRQNVCDGGGRGGRPGFVTGGGYNLWTMSMLVSLIFATVAVVHARLTAIFIWSLSAAFCAVSIWLLHKKFGIPCRHQFS